MHFAVGVRVSSNVVRFDLCHEVGVRGGWLVAGDAIPPVFKGPSAGIDRLGGRLGGRLRGRLRGRRRVRPRGRLRVYRIGSGRSYR